MNNHQVMPVLSDKNDNYRFMDNIISNSKKVLIKKKVDEKELRKKILKELNDIVEKWV